MSAAKLIAGHLNAPYGPVVGEEDVVRAIRQGGVAAASAKSQAILSQIFIECEPRLVARCAVEIGSSYAAANMLYLDTLKQGASRSPAWEKAMGHLV